MNSKDPPEDPPKQKMCQKRLFEYLKESTVNAKYKQEDEETVLLKEKSLTRQKLTEIQYKEIRETEGLVYVKNGCRDKFGNYRDRQGGRPVTKERKVGVTGGHSSNSVVVGDERIYAVSAPFKVHVVEQIEVARLDFPMSSYKGRDQQVLGAHV